MNNKRRKELQVIIDRIVVILTNIERIKHNEEVCRDNIPENLHASDQYDRIDNAARALDDACYAFEEIIEFIAIAIE
jgi:hypothetical protein